MKIISNSFVIFMMMLPMQTMAESQLLLDNKKLIELFDSFSLKQDSPSANAIFDLIPAGNNFVTNCETQTECEDYSRSFFKLTSVLRKKIKSGDIEAISIASRLAWISDGEFTLEVMDLISGLLLKHPDMFLKAAKKNKVINQSLDRILESGFDSLSREEMCKNFSNNTEVLMTLKDCELLEIRDSVFKILERLRSEYNCIGSVEKNAMP